MAKEVDLKLIEYLRRKHRLMKEWTEWYARWLKRSPPRFYSPHTLWFYAIPTPDEEVFYEVLALMGIYEIEGNDEYNRFLHIYLNEYQDHDPYLSLLDP
jgi:hypothetical protein